MDSKLSTTFAQEADENKLIIFFFESQIMDSKFWLSEWKNLKYLSLTLILCVLIVFPSFSITLIISLYIIFLVFKTLIKREKDILSKIINNLDNDNQISQFNL